MKNLKMIAPLAMGPPASPRRPGSATPEILSPRELDFPSLKLSSPVTPLTGDPFNQPPASSEEAERAAIAERRLFLHPSPRGADALHDAGKSFGIYYQFPPSVLFYSYVTFWLF